MNPTKGIDPKVWEVAEKTFERCRREGLWCDGSGPSMIYHAIMDEVEAEREECAKVADPIHCEGRMSDYEKQAFDIRDVISQAIRNRSNTTTERNEG